VKIKHIVTYRTCVGLDDWIYCNLYFHTVRNYRQYSPIAILHTFQFTVTHALGFSVFTSRILATDLSQSHCHFNSHVKSSWHSLILSCCFFSIALDCHLQNSTQFFSFSITSLHDYCSLLRRIVWLCPLITPRHGPHGKHCLLLPRMRVYWSVTYCRVRLCCWNVFTDPLPSNGYICHNMNPKISVNRLLRAERLRFDIPSNAKSGL
jgi:hypothetical protein